MKIYRKLQKLRNTFFESNRKFANTQTNFPIDLQMYFYRIGEPAG